MSRVMVAKELLRLAKQIAGADADSEYKQKVRAVRKLLKELSKKVDEHEKEQKRDPRNWGNVGDMGHYMTELEDLVRPR